MTLKVAIYGSGVVGGALLEHLQTLKSGEVEVRYVFVRDANNHKLRDHLTGVERNQVSVSADDDCRQQTAHVGQVVDDWRVPLADSEVAVVVEVIGGVTLAKDIVEGALRSGKHVVTANKALLARYGDYLNRLAQESSLQLLFEASVCGGVPLIGPVLQHYARTNNKAFGVTGILNGTCNFILSQMESNRKRSYSEVLREAQELGYAESDPSSDVLGYDTRSKTLLLSHILFNTSLSEQNEQKVVCEGITDIAPIDFDYAELLNCRVKLVGLASRRNINVDSKVEPLSDSPNVIDLVVMKAIIKKSLSLANPSGSDNAVLLTSARTGATFFQGPGAGGAPTANAVLADLLSIDPVTGSIQTASSTQNSLSSPTESELTAQFWLRFHIRDELGVVRKVAQEFETSGVSIHSVMQLPFDDPQSLYFGVLTDSTTLSLLHNLRQRFTPDSYSFLLSKPVTFILIQ